MLSSKRWTGRSNAKAIRAVRVELRTMLGWSSIFNLILANLKWQCPNHPALHLLCRAICGLNLLIRILSCSPFWCVWPWCHFSAAVLPKSSEVWLRGQQQVHLFSLAQRQACSPSSLQEPSLDQDKPFCIQKIAASVCCLMSRRVQMTAVCIQRASAAI